MTGVWVYIPGQVPLIMQVDSEEFARTWCDYYANNIYFFAELVTE